MTEPSFWDKWEWARAHRKPEPNLTVDNSRADRASMAVIPTTTPALVPPINGPAARSPSDTEFGFDPKGLGLVETFVKYPLDTIAAGTLGLIASKVADQQYPGYSDGMGGHNQECDAFRHSYWNAAMAKTFGAERAQEFSDMVERRSWNKPGERQMDLYNNRAGRGLADQPGPLADTIKKAIMDGRLRTRPF
ncbi:MAG: hypothetical protein V4601_13890 [Pseudomonadota bacterium]